MNKALELLEKSLQNLRHQLIEKTALYDKMYRETLVLTEQSVEIQRSIIDIESAIQKLGESDASESKKATRKRKDSPKS